MATPPPLRALGAMSGTSLDGLDAAVIVTDGDVVYETAETAYRPYSEGERAVLRAALGKTEGPEADAAARVVEEAHIALLSGFGPVDVVGMHGQTLHHDPARGITHQAGDGARVAEALDRTVIWDFRSADVGMGGQGAPLAPFYHFACAARIGARRPFAVLNLGGVGNLTWVDPRHARPEDPGALLAFDTGPANARVNDLMEARRGAAFDEGGRLAASGTADLARVRRLADAASYLPKIPPKSLDRQDFSDQLAAVADLSDADAAATLTAFAAEAVARGMVHLPDRPERLLVAGGGRKNPTLMDMIAARVACDVAPVEEVGLDGDMLEAEAFAHLAVRVLRGRPTSAPGTTGVAAPVGGGQVSRAGTGARASWART